MLVFMTNYQVRRGGKQNFLFCKRFYKSVDSISTIFYKHLKILLCNKGVYLVWCRIIETPIIVNGSRVDIDASIFIHLLQDLTWWCKSRELWRCSSKFEVQILQVLTIFVLSLFIQNFFSTSIRSSLVKSETDHSDQLVFEPDIIFKKNISPLKRNQVLFLFF